MNKEYLKELQKAHFKNPIPNRLYIERIVSALLEEEPEEPWEPAEGERYWLVNANIDIEVRQTKNFNNQFDKARKTLGNMFKTEEEAQAKLEEIKKIFKK